MSAGVVYFVQIGATGPVKIGLTHGDDVAKRLASLQTAVPWDLHVRRVVKSDAPMLLERTLHQRFLHLRMRGEWFAPDEELTAFMASDDPFPPDSRLRVLRPMPNNVVSLRTNFGLSRM